MSKHYGINHKMREHEVRNRIGRAHKRQTRESSQSLESLAAELGARWTGERAR